MAGARIGSDLATRSVIGAALAAVAVAVLWAGGVVLWALLTVGAMIALIEWGGLVKAHRARLGIGLIVLLLGMSYSLPILWGTDRSTLALLLIAAALFFGATRWFEPLSQWISARYVVAALLLVALLSLAPRLFGVRKSLTILATGWLMVTIGWLGAWIHLLLFDHWFLRVGAVRRDSQANSPRGPARDGVAAGSGAVK